MGVPAFFRWLSRKYPSIVVSCVEDKNAKEEDMDGPNPNQIEFDNLYLDMNGIIHPCCHPEYKSPPETEEEMMMEIFAYIDRLINILRPRKLLYMAVDGVAPRAKMNQQRSRRFRASQESTEMASSLAKVRAEIAAKGIVLPDEKNKHKFDSNCITPGTPFMNNLSLSLRYYIQDRLSNHPAWKNLKVILSDANVPGEGEHKIMDYIRKQRASPDHDPNTHHCLCGADADLIMLGLATHEPHFTIIREEFKPNQSKPCDLCKQKGHELKDCTGQGLMVSDANNSDAWTSSSMDEAEDPLLEGLPQDTEATFLFIRLDVLRQYLERELLYDFTPRDFAQSDPNNKYYNNNSSPSSSPNMGRRSRPKKFKDLDLERVIDDWVFLCFFVGNDFLPHLPSLEIRENAIDRLVRIYKETLNELDGYLTCNGSVNLKAAQTILFKLGDVEDAIFKQRQENELRFKRREDERKQQEHMAKNNSLEDSTYYQLGKQSFNPMNSNQPIKFIPEGANAKEIKNAHKKIPTLMPEDDNEGSDEDKDAVRLYEDGFKDRYYAMKFGIDPKDVKFRNEVAIAYAKGLCWVLLYYYQGCPCWNWFFPYHYAPFASDFVDIFKKITNNFPDKMHPFKPLEQLMAVFPASSGKHLPTPWADLMTAPDSPILDFYPTHFKIDLNGKRFAWQGVALLPFVEEGRLLRTLRERVYDKLTPFETILNSRGFDRLYVSENHEAYSIIKSILATNETLEEMAKKGFITLNATLCQGMAGSIKPDMDFMKSEKEMPGQIVSPLPDLSNKTLKAVGVLYKDPSYTENYVFQANILPDVNMPVECLKPMDWDDNKQGRYRPPLGFGNNVTCLEKPRQQIDASGRRIINQALNNAIAHNSSVQNKSTYHNHPPQSGSNANYSNRSGPLDDNAQRSLSYTGDRSETRRQQNFNNSNNFNNNYNYNGGRNSNRYNNQTSIDSYMSPGRQNFSQNNNFNNSHQQRGGPRFGQPPFNTAQYYSPRPPGAMGNSPNPRLRILQRSALAHNMPPPPMPNFANQLDQQNTRAPSDFNSSNYNWQQKMMLQGVSNQIPNESTNNPNNLYNSYLNRIATFNNPGNFNRGEDGNDRSGRYNQVPPPPPPSNFN